MRWMTCTAAATKYAAWSFLHDRLPLALSRERINGGPVYTCTHLTISTIEVLQIIKQGGGKGMLLQNHIISSSVFQSYNNNNNRIQRRNSRFFTISSLHREPSPTRMPKWPGAVVCKRMLHIERLSRATCRVMCHLVRRDSSATKFYRV